MRHHGRDCGRRAPYGPAPTQIALLEIDPFRPDHNALSKVYGAAGMVKVSWR
jgi:hypothetical protein